MDSIGEAIVTEDEMRELVHRLTTSKSSAQVPDVAEALGVAPELVREMLADIRNSSSEKTPKRALVLKPRRQESEIRTYLIFAFAIVLVLALLANSIVHQSISASERANNVRNVDVSTVAPVAPSESARPLAPPTRSSGAN